MELISDTEELTYEEPPYDSGVFFSPKNTSFYPAAWKDDGTYTDLTWPTDAIRLTDEEQKTYWKVTPPEGKIIGVNGGRPAWVDLPPPSKEQIVMEATEKKSQLKSAADSEIDWRQDAVDVGDAREKETLELAAWKKYRIALMRIDTSKAPNITWPNVTS